jgi:hypothetical protein
VFSLDNRTMPEQQLGMDRHTTHQSSAHLIEVSVAHFTDS